jgi:hypothetical protein
MVAPRAPKAAREPSRAALAANRRCYRPAQFTLCRTTAEEVPYVLRITERNITRRYYESDAPMAISAAAKARSKTGNGGQRSV